MPTKQRLQARADADEELPLKVAAIPTGYASETLRVMMFRDPNPPPLKKRRGKWFANPDALAAWVAARDSVAS